MCPTNDFLPFCPTDTGTNLLSESDYAAATDRTSGNKPGIASAKLNNKALRQASYITGQLAQLISNINTTDVLDDAVPAKLLSLMTAALAPIAPIVNALSSAGTFNLTYFFFIASGNATAAATYTNSGHTYTVTSTIAAGLILQCTGPAAPGFSGTLTKATGAGDATITFYAMRAPLYMDVEIVGAGGGGQSSGSGSRASGGSPAAATFGTAFLSASSGAGGSDNQNTGSAAATGGDYNIPGGNAVGSFTAIVGGIAGAASFFGGEGAGGVTNGNGAPGVVGGGGGGGGGGTGINCGGGGGAGSYCRKRIFSPSTTSTWAYSVPTGGAGGTPAGTGGNTGGAGGDGTIRTAQYFQ